MRHLPMIGSVALRCIYFITAAGLIAAGLGFILGPAGWRTSPSYTVARDLMSITGWGVLMIVAGLWKMFAYIIRSRLGIRLAAAFGGATAFAWGMALMMAAVGGSIQGWSGVPAWLTIAGVQLAGAAEWSPGHRA